MAVDNTDRHLENRKFLHDIASPMMVLKLCLKKFNPADPHNGTSLSPEKLQEIMKRALDSLDKMERLHADFKMVLAEREAHDQNELRKSA